MERREKRSPCPNPPSLPFQSFPPVLFIRASQVAAWKEDARLEIQARIDEKQANEEKHEAAVSVWCVGEGGSGEERADNLYVHICTFTHFTFSPLSFLSGKP